MSSFPLPLLNAVASPSPPPSMVMATNTSKKQSNQSPQELGESEPQRRDAGEESEEESSSGEEEGQDDFFESFDRVPSRVSFCLDLPSDDSDAEDDVRMSFSSAVGDLRCVTFSREEFLAQHRDDDDTPIEPSKEKQGSGGFQDYGIWMDEPMSVNDRRRRLLQGMGFASKRDYAASLRIRSIRSIRRPPMDAPPPAHTAGSLPPLPPSTAADAPSEAAAPEPQPVDSSPTPAAEQPPVLTRCRSDTDLAALRPDSCSVLLRSASFPRSAWDVRVKERSSNGIEDADEGDRGELVVADEQACLTKNQNTEELAVCEVEKDGPEEAQTGLQVTPLGEFERILGSSPIVKELMRRVKIGGGGGAGGERGSNAKIPKSGGKKKGGWLKNIKFVASSVGLISEKADAGTKTGAKASGESSSELMKVRLVGKSSKELTGLCMSQEIQAHQGSIWCIKFSWDGRLLASAGEDRIVQVWQVQESDTARTKPDGALLGSTKKTKKTKSGKRILPDYIVLPETIFSLSEKPVCSFEGHQDDVLDLSWSKSQHLLSSSMDKTVRLWDMETMTCLKLFAHNDYVTCIQFNPVDDNYFISGSLDAKVRIWNIPVRQVVDWTDLHEMVTAACYTPDGQGALVGSHKGTCRLYKTSDCKLTQENQIDIKNKKKKAQAKKITGLQYAPDNSSEVMITSADSLIRVFDELKMVHKFRGLRNTSSQISASFSSDGKYVICASEDSNVYVWKRDATRPAAKGAKTWITTRSHESFFCKDVSVAIPWPCAGSTCPPLSLPATSGRLAQQEPSGATESVHSTSTLDVDPFPSGRNMCPPPLHKKSSSEQCLPTVDEQRSVVDSPSGSGSDSFASPSATTSAGDSVGQSSSMPARGWNTGSENKASSADQSNAWGLVVVTAGMGGDIKVYQNFGLPVRLSRQTNIF